MKNLRYFIIILTIAASWSCDDNLLEKPQGFVSPDQFYNSEAEAEAAIFGVYDFLNNEYIGEYQWILMGDLGTDVSVTRNIARFGYQYGDLSILPAEHSDIWRTHYRAIGAANAVINRVGNSDKFSDEFKLRIVAEAKFLRAFFYHHLNLVWGNVPMWLDELVLDDVEYLGNSTSDEVKAQIIKDLTEAADQLPIAIGEEGRVNAWIAKGLLARVYLLDNQWQNAKSIAQDIISNSGYALLPNYADVFDFKNSFNSELMHVVPKIADIEPSIIHSHSHARPTDDNGRINIPAGAQIIRPDGVLTTDLNSRNSGSLFQGWGVFQSMKENFDSYAADDSRRDMWWHEIKFTDGTSYSFHGGGSVGNPGRSGYYNLKWIAWDEVANNGGRNTHLQRLGEIYLILAEAENELNGPTAIAYDAINQIRRRAFGDTSHDLTGLSKEEFRSAIIDENKWELAGEGLRRWYLWHWGYDEYMKVAATVTTSNPQLAQNLQSHYQYFRIPDEEIAKNPNLKQNAGYN